MKSLSQTITEGLSNHLIPPCNLVMYLNNMTGNTSAVIEQYGDHGICVSSSRFNTPEGINQFMQCPLPSRHIGCSCTVQSFVWECGLQWYVKVCGESEVKLVAIPVDVAGVDSRELTPYYAYHI